MTIDDARKEFPALRNQVFLDSACVSLAPQRAVDKLRAFLDMAATCPSGSATQQHLDMDAMRSAARPPLAKLINASEDDIALMESTTQGMSLVANAIPLKRGDRVVVCDLEFVAVALPWVQKRQEIGIEIDVVPNRNGQILVEDIEAAITANTRVVAISSVQWSNGFLCDLDALSRLCRGRGLFLIVDAIQQIGAIPLDVQKTPVDAIACGGHKWLLAPFGCGFLYLSKDFRAKVTPPLAGYLSEVEPEDGWGTYFRTPTIKPVREYDFVDAARRWEAGGTANYPGAIALAESAGLINEIGIEKVGEHVLCLTDYLIDSLQQQGVEIVTPLDRRNRSSIVTFTVGDVDQNVALVDYLQQHKVLVSLRYTSGVGGVRVACHLFNNREDIGRLVEATSEFVRRHTRATA
ncbi:MAG: aminotransferase class V-fold PLP-dependent enzyme [Candidatus Korobacteraceae bacterium]|jgi:selenocysteine lyase/cysteine desulfurase